MKRWHKSSCESPEVVLTNSDSSLHCENCHSHVSLDETHEQLELHNSRSPPEKREEPPLKWPTNARYLGEFSSAVEVTQPPRKFPRVASAEDRDDELPRPELLFDDEIRLIQFMPRDDLTGPVHVRFEKVHLRQSPLQMYDAVCYTCSGGSWHPWKPVFVGNYWDMIYVPRNCEVALKNIRELGPLLPIWIDELCIDLNDTIERNHQAALSCEIYKHARNTITFICDSSSETEQIFEMLNRPDSSGFIDLSTPEIQSAWEYFSRLPIFSRVWVLQELLLSQRIVLISGSKTATLRWTGMKKVPENLNSTDPSILQRLFDTRSSSFELLDLLLIASQYECSDPRDKIFGVLGLTEDNIRPEYSLSVEDAYTGIAAYLATYVGDMRMLNFAGSNRSDLELPSWVPDWSQKHDLQIPRHEVRSSEIDIEGVIPFSFHDIVPSNVEALVDPKSRGLQCSAIKLCSFNSKERQLILPILERGGPRRVVYPRDKRGNILTSFHEIQGLVGSTSQSDTAAFLLRGLDHPVILRRIPERDVYLMIATCVVGVRSAGSQNLQIPWIESSETETMPEMLDIRPLTSEDTHGIMDLDHDVLKVIQELPDITLNPELNTEFDGKARFLDLVKIFLLELPQVERSLINSWRDCESRLNWMFQDHRKLWSFVEYLQEQESGVRGTEKLPHEGKLSTLGPHVWKLPSNYTWDLERFCSSFVSGSSSPPAGYEEAEPEELITHISDIRTWAQITEKILRFMAFTEKYVSSNWTTFPGNDMSRTWLAPFETGVWKWEKFCASFAARERIFAMLLPDNLDPRVNHNIKMRLVMSQVGLHEDPKLVTLV